MKNIEIKAFTSSDDVRNFEKGKVELVNVDGRTVGRATLEPGWRWSQSVKPLAKTESAWLPTFSTTSQGPSV